MVSSGALNISVILSSPILRGTPGRSASLRPSIRLSAPSGIHSVAAEDQLSVGRTLLVHRRKRRADLCR